MPSEAEARVLAAARAMRDTMNAWRRGDSTTAIVAAQTELCDAALALPPEAPAAPAVPERSPRDAPSFLPDQSGHGRHLYRSGPAAAPACAACGGSGTVEVYAALWASADTEWVRCHACSGTGRAKAEGER